MQKLEQRINRTCKTPKPQQLKKVPKNDINIKPQPSDTLPAIPQEINTDRTQMNNIQNGFEPVMKKKRGLLFTQVNHVNFISEASINKKLELIN